MINGTRFCLMQDDSCRWYCLPVKLVKEWVKTVNFERYRIDGPHRLTFVNPVEE